MPPSSQLPDADDPAVFGDDDGHPVPYLEKLDIVAKARNGGAYLVVVIASPLMDDDRSVQRLNRKLGNYLVFIASDEFRSEFGAPNPATTTITVVIHPASSPRIFELLERAKPLVAAHQASLVIEKRIP